MQSLEVDVLDLTHLLSRFKNRVCHRQVLDCDFGAAKDGDLRIGASSGLSIPETRNAFNYGSFVKPVLRLRGRDSCVNFDAQVCCGAQMTRSRTRNSKMSVLAARRHTALVTARLEFPALWRRF